MGHKIFIAAISKTAKVLFIEKENNLLCLNIKTIQVGQQLLFSTALQQYLWIMTKPE